MSFIGFAQQESSLKAVLLTKNAARTPTNADALPTFRVYGPDGFLVNGTCTVLDAVNVPGGYRWSVAATGANGFAAGQNYAAIFTYAVNGIQQAQAMSFSVV